MSLRTEHLARCIVTLEKSLADHGAHFAKETLVLLPDFLTDARLLETTLRERFGDADA